MNVNGRASTGEEPPAFLRVHGCTSRPDRVRG